MVLRLARDIRRLTVNGAPNLALKTRWMPLRRTVVTPAMEARHLQLLHTVSRPTLEARPLQVHSTVPDPTPAAGGLRSISRLPTKLSRPASRPGRAHSTALHLMACATHLRFSEASTVISNAGQAARPSVSNSEAFTDIMMPDATGGHSGIETPSGIEAPLAPEHT